MSLATQQRVRGQTETTLGPALEAVNPPTHLFISVSRKDRSMSVDAIAAERRAEKDAKILKNQQDIRAARIAAKNLARRNALLDNAHYLLVNCIE